MRLACAAHRLGNHRGVLFAGLIVVGENDNIGILAADMGRVGHP